MDKTGKSRAVTSDSALSSPQQSSTPATSQLMTHQTTCPSHTSFFRHLITLNLLSWSSSSSPNLEGVINLFPSEIHGLRSGGSDSHTGCFTSAPDEENRTTSSANILRTPTWSLLTSAAPSEPVHEDHKRDQRQKCH